MNKAIVVSSIASLVDARLTCTMRGNTEWEEKHTTRINEIVDNYLPRGSGFDEGTKIDLGRSTGEKLVFTTSFHHMNENGCYGGWTEHDVIVTPSLFLGFRVKVTGRDRNDIKNYIGDAFHFCLAETIK